MSIHDGTSQSSAAEDKQVILNGDGHLDDRGHDLGLDSLPAEQRRSIEQSLIYARELRRVFADLERKEAQHKVLLAKVISAQEDERRRIAQDIHDDVLQMLGFNLMKIDYIQRLWETGDPEAALEQLGSLRETIEDAINTLREIITALRPATLDHQGLLPTVDEFLKRFRRDTGIEVYLTSKLGRRQEPALETLVFRLVQEALANVRKHSGASHVSVDMKAENGAVCVIVEDNGKGFIVEDALRRSLERGSIGLHSMIERVELAGGEWTIESQPGHGATIRFSVPV